MQIKFFNRIPIKVKDATSIVCVYEAMWFCITMSFNIFKAIKQGKLKYFLLPIIILKIRIIVM